MAFLDASSFYHHIVTRSWVGYTHRHAIIMRCRITRHHITSGSLARSNSACTHDTWNGLHARSFHTSGAMAFLHTHREWFVMLSIPIIILWFRKTHRHAIIILWLEVVSWTDASSCYHHLVTRSCELDRHIVLSSSSCDFDRRIVMLSSSCDSKLSWTREASIKLRNFRTPLKEHSWVWCEYSHLGQGFTHAHISSRFVDFV